MVRWSPEQFRMAAVSLAVVALVMVGAIEGLQVLSLPLWLHIPLMMVVLGLLSIGALAAGAAFAEYRARSVTDREQAQ